MKSSPLSEIESLLRMARENIERRGTSDEEIGPGDVQYLRSDSMTRHESAAVVATSEWPELSRSPDSLLHQAEKHLADAILYQRREPTPPSPTEFDTKTAGVISHPMERQSLTLEDLGELDLEMTVELGRTEILIEDILKLREGSVVSLDKLARDPVDIVANGRLVARGELLVIDGKFGVRLSEVL